MGSPTAADSRGCARCIGMDPVTGTNGACQPSGAPHLGDLLVRIGAYGNKRLLLGYIGPLGFGLMNTEDSCQIHTLQMATPSWLLALMETELLTTKALYVTLRPELSILK